MRYCRISEMRRWSETARTQGIYSIYPVEYKKGKPKHSEEDILQLTAQAMCLEEMFSDDSIGRGNFLWRNQKT